MTTTQTQEPRPEPSAPGTRLLIADDHGLVRETIAAFIMQATSYAVETVGSLAEAKAACARQPFDLALLDLDMPGMDEKNPLQTLQTLNLDMAIAILSANDQAPVMQEAFANGARGYIPKTMPLRSLVPILNLMLSGETFVPRCALDPCLTRTDRPQGLTMPQGTAPPSPLKPIDTDMLRMIQEGKSNKEIAAMREATENQVKTWLRVIFRRIGARNRTHAVEIARRNNWL